MSLVGDIIGYGTTLELGTDGVTYSFVTELLEVERPGKKRKVVDRTHLLSPSRAREKLAGLIDSGQVKVKHSYQPVLETTLNSYFDAGTLLYWRITIPDGTVTNSTVVFRAFVAEGPSGPFPMDDLVASESTLEVSGKPTWTQGS